MAFQGAKVVKKIFMAKCLPVIFFICLAPVVCFSLQTPCKGVFKCSLYSTYSTNSLRCSPFGKRNDVCLFHVQYQFLEVLALWEKE